MMKIIPLSALSLSLLSLSSGCTGEVDDLRQVEQSLTAGVPVGLYFAQGTTTCAEYDEFGTCSNMLGKSTVHGYVEVENLAYDKGIFVHYESEDGSWKDAVATYAGPTEAGKEAWFFETEPKFHAPRLGVTFPFAIRYEVNGQTYWDNNEGENYLVGAGARTLAPERVFGTGAVDLTRAQLATLGIFSGSIDVRNIAFDKRVELVYSTDDWQTVEFAAADFGYPSGDWERWFFNVDLGAPTTQIDFAIRYEVAGTTHWDNNFGQDYTVVSGSSL